MVEEDFSCDDAGSFCADIVGVVNTVASSCPADSSWFCLVWSVCCHNSEVGGFFVFGNLAFVDEEHCVSSLFHVLVSLREASDFIYILYFPKFSI